MTNSRSANASQALEEISFLHERKHSTKGKESTAVFEKGRNIPCPLIT